MFKKFLSVLLAVMMLVSVLTVAVVTSGAAETPVASTGDLEATKLYFDASSTGWDMGAKGKIAFYIFGGDFNDTDHKTIAWGGKKALGTAVAGMDGVFSFDPAAKGVVLNEGVQYKIIFGLSKAGTGAIDGGQTYDLLFDTTCLGSMGYCDGTEYENPVDSSKKTLAAFWKDGDGNDLDRTAYGPVLQISSIGNVVGTCPEDGKTPESIFVDFISVVSKDSGKTGLANARVYVVDVGTKTEQQLIDDIGTDLGLTKDDIKNAFDENAEDSEGNEITTTWSYDDSTLPSGSAPTTEPATEPPHVHTPGEPVKENDVPATCQQAGGYDMVTYCIVCGEEISREHTDVDQLEHTPGDPVKENDVPATCQQAGGYDMVTYCSECSTELSREHTDIGKLLHTPGEPVQENFVPATCKQAGGYDTVTYCTECGDELSREHTDIGKLLHTPGEPVQDMMAGYPATCTENGLKVMVTYCTECGDELSRETIDIDMVPHAIIHMDEVPATATVDGMKEHYECENCGACFSDAEGQNEVDPETLVIKAQFIRGDADSSGELETVDATFIQRFCCEVPLPETWNPDAADADLDGTVDIIDATLIQRVLAEITTFEAWDAKHASK